MAYASSACYDPGAKTLRSALRECVCACLEMAANTFPRIIEGPASGVLGIRRLRFLFIGNAVDVVRFGGMCHTALAVALSDV